MYFIKVRQQRHGNNGKANIIASLVQQGS